MAGTKYIQSGNTSTCIPCAAGKDGTRSPVTFFTDSDIAKDSSTETDSSSFYASIDGSICKILHNYPDYIEPAKDDYIIYSTTNKTYLTYITDSSNNVWLTETLDTWETTINTKESSVNTNNIDLSITCRKWDVGHRSFTAYIVPDGSVTARTDSTGQLHYYELPFIDDDSTMQKFTDGLRFTVASRNSQALGSYKIQVEFTTKHISPRMDTKIADKFLHPTHYPQHKSNYGTDEKSTIIGYITNYSAVGMKELTYSDNIDLSNVTTQNFDDEYLDNFVITVKDYDEGVGYVSYTSDVYLPIEMFKRVKAIGDSEKYKADMYIYIQDINKNIHKIWMFDCTDMLEEIYK